MDVVVIGSGAGGLVAAVALARAGEKVLVVEQHYLPGGWCHSFDLEGYHFSPGVHYLGELGPGGRLRKIYEGLGIANDLTFLELDPEGYDEVRIGPDYRFRIPKGTARYAERLGERFPADRDGIRRFLQRMDAMASELSLASRASGGAAMALPWSCRTLAAHGWRSVGAVAEELVKDPLARATLLAIGGDYGVPPSRAPAGLHAAVQGHYADGAWYPKGGARALPKAMLKELRRRGGDIRVKSRVAAILVEGRRAIGVRLADGTEIRARTVVSNADPHATFGLLPEEAVPRRIRWRLSRTTYSVSTLSLFLAADVDPAAAGIGSGNVWALGSPDLEAAYRWAADPDPLSAGPVPAVFLTCTTAKDPGKRRDGVATFEAFAFVSDAAFRRFADEAERPAAYESLKEQLGDRLLDRVEALVPGIRGRLRLRSVGTPLTNRHFLAATAGSIYGIEKGPWQLGPFAFPSRTPIAGLHLCGASTQTGHGVLGATMSGLVAAREVLGAPRWRDVLDRRGQELTTVPASPVAA